MTPTRRRVLALAALAALAPPPAHAAADPASAEGFIQSLGNRTLAVLDRPASPPEKLAELKRLLDESTDLELVGRLVLGRHWRQATPDQRQEYTRLFKALVMQTMAERFSWYTGETFEIIGAKPVDERDTMVATRILRPSGKPPIVVDWRVRRGADGAFLLIDIVAEGVSLVVTQRAEAAEVINRGGIDGLLGEMRTRLERRAATG